MTQGVTLIPGDVVPLLAQVTNRPVVTDNAFHMGVAAPADFSPSPSR